MSTISRRLFGISPEATSFDKLGFRETNAESREKLERVARTFVHGYNVGLEIADHEELGSRLNEIDPAYRGWAFEGAGMSLTVLDILTPWKRDRLQRFLAGPAAPHTLTVYVGAGWAVARLGWGMKQLFGWMDPVYRWLAWDGFGFHMGFFRGKQYIRDQTVPKVDGYGVRAFDHGLGRSLWFVQGGDPARVAEAIHAFAPSRHADLWGGVGLAVTFAGSADPRAMEDVRRLAGEHASQLGVGAALAALARHHAGNTALHTDTACEVLWQKSARDVAILAEDARKTAPGDGIVTAYEAMRERIRTQQPTRLA